STMADPADQFPKAVGTTLIVPAAEKDQLSPVPTNISLEPPPKSPIGTIHEGETLEERKNIMRPVDRGPSGEKLDLPDANNTPRSVKSKRRTQFYDGQFSDKDATGMARDRVVKDSPVVAELKTNVIIKDEYTLVTDLSSQLSQRFQRPESSIMISLQHSTCLLLSGSFEPAYVLSLTTVPSLVQPVTNKRNAALLQQFLDEILNVTPERGIIRFHPLEEANLATNGRTVLGEIEREQKKQAEANGEVKRPTTKQSRRSFMLRAKTQPPSRNGSMASASIVTPPLASPLPFDVTTPIPERAPSTGEVKDLSPVDSKLNVRTAKRKSMAPMKSTPNLNGYKAPAIPESKPMPKMSKRKSFIALFKK
ncbi:Tautomerase/MIF superfamily, partial [Phyllosticta capitalensis]|uniref:Tautomerase/MIF superfamily n=1 Tax=Phyllosticta capitalensis TaxID=121624 RepID=UPI00312F4DA7